MATILDHKILLFEAQTVDASSTAEALTSAGDKYIIVAGALGGGTLAVEIANEGGTFVPMDGGDFTAAGARILFGIPKSALIRVTLSGSTAANIDVEITK